jgi:hypothetical protein
MCFKTKKKTRIQLFLVTFIYSDYSHFQYKLGFFWYEWSSLKRSFHSRFKGPRVPEKTQPTHELVKQTTIIPLQITRENNKKSKFR